MTTKILQTTPDCEIVTSRTINIPVALVYKAWTDPKHLQKWWGPNGFTNTFHEFDFRIGGKWSFIMHGPEKGNYANECEFIKIEKESLIAWKRYSKPLFQILVTFEKVAADKTKVVFKQLFATAEECNKIKPYVTDKNEENFDRLEMELQTMILLSNEPVIVERTFNMAADKIWAALSDAIQMKQWYFDLSAFKAEPGFNFQFYGTGKEGEKYLHLCTVQETILNKKISYTWQYDGFEGNSLVSFELFTQGDTTKLMLTHAGLETFPSTTNAFAKENFVDGWTYLIHTSLKEFLEKN